MIHTITNETIVRCCFGPKVLLVFMVTDGHQIKQSLTRMFVGAISGMGGAALAYIMFRFLRSAVTESPFSQEDLVGRDAYVSVSIPRTEWGTVSMEVEGTTQSFRATSSVDIDRGEVVRISGATGNGLIVEPTKAAATAPEVPTDVGQDETS